MVTKEEGSGTAPVEANAILIAHPENKMLGTRFRIVPGATLEVGRSAHADISLADVPSVSRQHARLSHSGAVVLIEDLGSTNGTWINDRPLRGPSVLKSGDRFQVGAVHFKFLHESDVEHAYHTAVYEMMIRDGLTQAFNKQKFEEDARREFARARRYGRPLSLILFDLDHFKNVNDRRGHLCGDLVLRHTAAAVMPLFRTEQVFARVGGEEFAVLCPEVPVAGTLILAERLRECVARLSHRHGRASFHVTCSVGVAGFEHDMDGFSQLYDAADRALYRSKDKGRNKVTVKVLD